MQQIQQLLISALPTQDKISQYQPPMSTLSYPSSYRGTPEARSAMARMAQRTFMKVRQCFFSSTFLAD